MAAVVGKPSPGAYRPSLSTTPRRSRRRWRTSLALVLTDPPLAPHQGAHAGEGESLALVLADPPLAPPQGAHGGGGEQLSTWCLPTLP